MKAGTHEIELRHPDDGAFFTQHVNVIGGVRPISKYRRLAREFCFPEARFGNGDHSLSLELLLIQDESA